MPDKLPVTTDIIWQSQMNRDLVESQPASRQISENPTSMSHSQEPVFGFRDTSQTMGAGDIAEAAAKVDELFTDLIPKLR